MSKLSLPLPPQISTDPAVDAQALAWAALQKDQLEKLVNGNIDSANIKDGSITNADLAGGYPQLSTVGQAICNAQLTLTTTDQDVPNCSVSLPAGTYIVWGVFDAQHVLNGGGVIMGKLNVGGSVQSPQILLGNTGSANGDRATVAQAWPFSIASTFTTKLQAVKTINAGTAVVNATHTTLTYLRIA